MQAEYAYYNRDEERYALQATLVGIIYLPTGSIKKNPSTRINAPSFLIETTLSYTGVDWYAFVSPGVFFPMSSQKKQTANKLLYQAGLGRNIGYSSKKWLLTPLIELYGAFSKKTSSNNSPGIYLHLGPNAWFATERLIIQAGVVFTVFQKKTTCCSNKNNYWAAINIGWKFN